MIGVVNWMMVRAERAWCALLPLIDRLWPLVRCTYPGVHQGYYNVATIRQVCAVVRT